MLTTSTLLSLLATPAYAAVVNTSNLTSYSVSSTDLLQTSVASVTSDNLADRSSGSETAFFNNLSSAGVTVGAASLTDGVWYDHDPTNPAFAGVGSGNAALDNTGNVSRGSAMVENGEFAQFNFDLSSATLGYDITAIDLFSNWGSGPGRDDIRVTISMALVGTPTLFDQVVVTNEFIEFENAAATQGAMNITGDGGGLIGTGIAAIRFDFPNQEAGAVGYSEIDVFGTATIPEPSSALLLGLGSLTLLRRRKG